MNEIGLNVGERIVALSVLPEEGNYVTLKLLRNLKSKLGLDADEHEKYEIKIDNKTKMASWNDKGVTEEVKLEFKSKEIEIIRTALEKLDKEQTLKDRHFSLFEKFVNEGETDGNIKKE